MSKEKSRKENNRKNKDKKSKDRKSRNKSGGFLWKLIFVVALVVFLYSSYQLATIYMEYKEGADEYSEVALQILKPVEEEEPVSPETAKSLRTSEDGELLQPEEPLPSPPEVDWEALRAINPDVIGWIVVEGVPSISYPVLQGKDNAYYLHRTVKGTNNFAGSIFIDYMNQPDFSDCNTIIYGHNMKNGSMFGYLKLLYEREQYKDSRYIWIATPEGNDLYEIFSMQKAEATSEVYTLFSEHDERFGEYVERMEAQSLVDLGVKELNQKDSMITLSTCTSDDNVRFVVQARWVGTY